MTELAPTGADGMIVCDRLVRIYSGEGIEVQALQGLDLLIAEGELTALIGAARVYVGPDTAITHLAVATGTPAVALYGPTDPRLWGPWPVGGTNEIWQAAGTIQRRGNVWLVQNPLPCMPCQLEGCERRLDSESQCLDELSPQQVIAAADQALAAAKR